MNGRRPGPTRTSRASLSPASSCPSVVLKGVPHSALGQAAAWGRPRAVQGPGPAPQLLPASDRLSPHGLEHAEGQGAWEARAEQWGSPRPASSLLCQLPHTGLFRGRPPPALAPLRRQGALFMVSPKRLCALGSWAILQGRGPHSRGLAWHLTLTRTPVGLGPAILPLRGGWQGPRWLHSGS